MREEVVTCDICGKLLVPTHDAICSTMNNIALILCEMLSDEGGMNP